MKKSELKKMQSIINTQLSIIRNRIEFIKKHEREQKQKADVQKQIDEYNQYNAISDIDLDYSSGFDSEDIEFALND
tara:strand:+ start:1345 stop:1572 length:228 start_codon:yes stop_codon:yes gene_type:complete